MAAAWLEQCSHHNRLNSLILFSFGSGDPSKDFTKQEAFLNYTSQISDTKAIAIIHVCREN